MKKIFTIIIVLGIALFVGCKAPRLTWTEVQDRYDANQQETINSMFYMGSDSSDHYFFHSFISMHRTVYRVSKSELTIKNEFPLTKDSNLWRGYQMPLRINVDKNDNVKIIKSEQNAPADR